MSKQQTETLVYFDSHATEWQGKSIEENKKEINVVKQRNDYVLKIIDKYEYIKSFLDLGCGTGQLVCESSKKNILSTGIDFSKNMIDIAIQNANEQNLKNANFVCSSIFDYDFKENNLDLISANGLIEYISFEELKKILSIIYKSLRKNGKLVIGSRNRLFNLFSLNKFTISEIENNKINKLITEAITLANSRDLDNFINEYSEEDDDDYDMPNTGIDVEIRKQYTPLQMICLLRNIGYAVNDLYPIHIHGVNPKFKEFYPIAHSTISNYLHNFAYCNYSLIPYASSFMVCATKE